MKLLTRLEIMKKLEKYVNIADGIDLAIAWITNSSGLGMLQNQAKQRQLKIRAIVGIDTNFTHPIALDELNKIADLRVVKSTQGIFHPKMYIFHLPNEKVVWIGSANFTNSGLNINEELVAEFKSSNNEAIQWFNQRWESIPLDKSKEMMEVYINNWLPPSSISNKDTTISDVSNQEINLNCSWAQYLEQLKDRNEYWIYSSKEWDSPFSIFGDYSSYCAVIADGHAITKYETWDNLTKQQATMLLGLDNSYGVHGLLGSMRGAGYAKSVFLSNNKEHLITRRTILNAIQNTMNISNQEDYIDAVRDAFEVITGYEGFAKGVATRLLTLARPDMAISLNSASEEGLSSFSGLAPSTLGTPDNYVKLLKWMYNLDWYKSPAPLDPWEKSIWDKRAALIDAFVKNEGKYSIT